MPLGELDDGYEDDNGPSIAEQLEELLKHTPLTEAKLREAVSPLFCLDIPSKTCNKGTPYRTMLSRATYQTRSVCACKDPSSILHRHSFFSKDD